MLELTMDMEQYDCPFIDTTDDHEVIFSAVQWSFDEQAHELETRMVVTGEEPTVIDQGLETLRHHDNMHTLDLLTRKGDRALIRTIIAETEAMSAIRGNDGYITGPFHIENGSESWEVGFDDVRKTENALSDLDQHNEFTIEEQTSMDIDALFDVLQNVDTAASLLESIRDLSHVERQTLSAAVEAGYFDEPRGVTLDDIAKEFDISDTAVSKNMRRAERKLIPSILDASDNL